MKQNSGISVQKSSRMAVSLFIITTCCFVSLSFVRSVTAKNNNYEIIVYTGEVGKTIEFLKSKNFWGASTHEKDLDVPRILLVVISKGWRKESQKIPVAVKKELFYRGIVPLILLANELILEEQRDVLVISEKISKNKTLSIKDKERLKELSLKYGVQDVAPLKKQIAALLERAETIPRSFALGQAAYDWPFDSVRSYMQNLNRHEVYEKLRTKRSSLRKHGQEVTDQLLAEALDKYSERDMEYVKTLKSIINVNAFSKPDKA